MAGNAADCEVMIDQSRAIDNRRLRRPLGEVPKPVLREVKEKLRHLGDF
jgi:mRNA-degrading endonuclease toxin of MazEF toxin-antitoxin module